MERLAASLRATPQQDESASKSDREIDSLLELHKRRTRFCKIAISVIARVDKHTGHTGLLEHLHVPRIVVVRELGRKPELSKLFN